MSVAWHTLSSINCGCLDSRPLAVIGWELFWLKLAIFSQAAGFYMHYYYHWLCVALLHLLRSTSFLGHHLLDSSHSQEMHNNFNKSPLRIYHAQEFRNAKWRKFGCWWRFVVLVYEFSSFTHWGKILKRLFSKVSNLHLQKSRS